MLVEYDILYDDVAKSNAVNTKLYAALKDAADIEDNRASFY